MPPLGVFRAPVKGAYYFTFAASHPFGGENVFVLMYKNTQLILDNYGFNNHPGWEYITNSLILQLEQGDMVYMRLPGGNRYRLYDGHNHNTFSGFLIYTL